MTQKDLSDSNYPSDSDQGVIVTWVAPVGKSVTGRNAPNPTAVQQIDDEYLATVDIVKARAAINIEEQLVFVDPVGIMTSGIYQCLAAAIGGQ